MARLWTGEAAKIRRKTLAAINTRCKKRVGESDLGRVLKGLTCLHSMPPNAPRMSKADMHVRMYADAMGVDVFEAGAIVARQKNRLARLGEPWGV